jgi:HlyD family secretion protein
LSKTKKLLLLPIALMLAGAAYWWASSRHDATADSAITLYGNVDIREVDLAFGTTEHIAELTVREGDRLAAGQVLGRLHTEKLDAAVAAADAAVNAQEQVVARLEAGNRPEEIRRAKAQVDSLAAKARTAQITYERQAKLGRQKLAAPEDVDQAKAAADAAEAETVAAGETYALAVAGSRVEDVAQAKAELAARRASLALARAQLADATLVAPAAGIVRSRILEPGDVASPQTPVYTLALLDPLWVRVYVSESDLGRVATGMKAEVRTDSYPDKVYAGWVGYISPTAEFTPKTVETPDLRTRLVYQARVFVCDPRGELRLGMPATVTVPLQQLKVPAESGAASPCGG